MRFYGNFNITRRKCTKNTNCYQADIKCQKKIMTLILFSFAHWSWRVQLFKQFWNGLFVVQLLFSISWSIDWLIWILLPRWSIEYIMHYYIFFMTCYSPKCLPYKQLDIMDTNCCDIKFGKWRNIHIFA